MTIKERLDSLRNKFKEKIKPESTPEELEELNGLVSELDEIETDYNKLSEEHGKFKDTIIRMALNQGDGKKPAPASEDSKPRSMEQFISDFENEHKEAK